MTRFHILMAILTLVGTVAACVQVCTRDPQVNHPKKKQAPAIQYPCVERAKNGSCARRGTTPCEHQWTIMSPPVTLDEQGCAHPNVNLH